jgi:hypothetical protein
MDKRTFLKLSSTLLAGSAWTGIYWHRTPDPELAET